MVTDIKQAFLEELSRKYGSLKKLDGSQSLYEICGTSIRVYIRYSKLHGRGRTFYGLREEDLRQLEGHPSLVCFLWDGQVEPLLIPFGEYEDVFRSVSPASDGQYKVQVYLEDDGTELYVAKAGRFNVEGQFGWKEADALVDSAGAEAVPELSHPQMQTLLGAIGNLKGYDVWIPPSDRARMDWSVANRFECRDLLFGLEPVSNILQEVDVIWIQKGSSEPKALFEVEQSTPIYSGLLRFNDVHLVAANLHPRFSVVANEARRSLFVRQLNRPTFRLSGLSGLCTFLEYVDVFGWHRRISRQTRAKEVS